MKIPGRKTLSLGTLLWFGLLSVHLSKMSAGEGSVRYSTSQVTIEPSDEMVQMRAHGGLARMVRIYSVMGDGRFTVSTSRNASASPELVASGRLSDDEVSTIVSEILRARLYAYDSASINARKRLDRVGGVTAKDAGSLDIAVSINLFPGTAADGNDELQRRFAVSGSDLRIGSFPSIEEFEAIRQILGILREEEEELAMAAVQK